jgi:protein-S-isoprenylcysteine O-methyltransferase Ste14
VGEPETERRASSSERPAIERSSIERSSIERSSIERSSIERNWERAADVALGLSSLSWAVLGLLNDEGPPMLARAAAALVNATVGLLFLFREGALAHGSAVQLARALPSVVLGGIAWRISGHTWPPALAVAFAVVAVLTCVTLLFLGRSFAIFPARRVLRDGGPYALVRHPLYLLELVLLGLAAAAHAWWAPCVLVPVALVTLHVRMRDEESLLASDPAYAAYRERVKYRLVPGLY